MITPEDVALWMKSVVERDGCLYQSDVVDHLMRHKADDLIIENNDGSLSISRSVLSAFQQLTKENVVWVRPDRYWRFRVAEDEPGREARG
tara:strand:+ start:400 stop:669 length:270 start_codon:yes stop_codon:yes gene_type:complete